MSALSAMPAAASSLGLARSLSGTPSGPRPAFAASASKLDELRYARRQRAIMRKLDQGDWKQLLIDAKRSQYKYRDTTRNDGKVDTLLVKVNAPRLAFKMHGSVLGGRAPVIKVAEGFDAQQDAVSDLTDRCLFQTLVQQAAVRVARDAMASFEIVLTEDGPALKLCDNNTMFPVGPDGPDGQPTVWEERWLIEKTSGREKVCYLRVKRHRVDSGVGVIENEAYLAPHADSLLDLSQLDRVELAQAVDVVPEERIETGVPYPLVVRLVADMSDGEPRFLVSEQDLDLFDSMAASLSRLMRIEELHGSPKLRISEENIGEDGKAKGLSEDAYVDPDGIIAYLQVQAQFDALLTSLDRLIELTLFTLGMAPTLVGLSGRQGEATAEQIRAESSATLAFATTAANYLGPALGRALTIASWLDTRRPGRGYPVDTVHVMLKPELPKDELALTRQLDEQLRAGVIDQRSAIARLHGDDVADQMVDAIRGDHQASATAQQSALFGSAFGDPVGDTQLTGQAQGGDS